MLNVGSNNISFKSNPVHNVHLRNTQGGYVKAVFSELNPKKAVDIDAVKQIQNTWKNAPQAEVFCSMFLDNSSKGSKYYALELFDKKQNLGDKILGLLVVDSYKDNFKKIFDLVAVQTKPDNKYCSLDIKRDVKGIGEVLLLESFRFAKKQKEDFLRVASSNNPFYLKSFNDAKIVFEEARMGLGASNFFIDKTNFDKYINYGRNKYKIEK